MRKKYEKSVLKKSELDKDTLYIICPDKKCKLFWETGKQPLPCPHECPKKDKLKYVVLCHQCKETIVLPSYFYNGLDHVTHQCANGMRPMWVHYFKKSHLLYKMPKQK